MRFSASDLFTLREVGSRQGKPAWANKRAYRQPRWKGVPEELAGPGIYALLLDNSLFYVGLFAGGIRDPFGGSVLDRWYKHITFQCMRAPEICFAPRELRKILAEIDGPVGDDIARCLPDGRDTDCSSLDPDFHPLIAGRNGPSCTFRKARFASRHWRSIGPDADPGDRILERMTCVYERIPEDGLSLSLLEGSSEEERASWVKFRWLKPREAELIASLRPMCNFEIEPGTERSDIGAAVAEAALAEALAKPLEAFAAGVRKAGQSTSARASDRPDGEAWADSDRNAGVVAGSDPDYDLEGEAVEALTERDTSAGEVRFRNRLSPAGEALTAEVERECPTMFSTQFTATPDFRVKLKMPDGRTERVLLRLSTSNGLLRGESLAGAAACRALGLQAEGLIGATMKSVFHVDPAIHGASVLFAVAGAATQALAG
ncbi:hypothetical protein [uncultured Methylobacterium sp.]|uniref:hypothetical protein n=1 Tax=uncultured Methylobacterium sp. TaxID=157278 RepID=UPI0025953952|nr:hypothetical protein [uncultured Methylobacterium sp.]